MLKNLYKIGFIKSTHGIKGQLEIKLFVNIDMIEFLHKNLFFLLVDDTYAALEIEEIFKKKQNFVIKFKNLKTINGAQKYLKSTIFLSEKDILNSSFKKKEYIINFDVVDSISMKVIGKILTVDSYKKNKTFSFLNFNNNKITIIPFVDEFIDKIDYNLKRIYVKLIQGL